MIPVIWHASLIFAAYSLFSNAYAASFYSETVILDKPLFYWSFDENEASSAAVQQMPLTGDPTSAENNLIAVQGAGARLNHAASGTGLRLGNAANLSGGFFQRLNLQAGKKTLLGAYAVELWFKSSTPVSQPLYLLNFGPSAGDNDPAVVANFTSNHIELFAQEGGRTGNGGPQLRDQLWHHLLVVHCGPASQEPNRVDFWVDGVHTPKAGRVIKQPDLRGIVVGAALPNGAALFKGQLDELAVYDWEGIMDTEVITAKGDRMATSHRAAARDGIGGDYSSLILKDNPALYWNFDEASGDAEQKAPIILSPPVWDNARNSLHPSGTAKRVSHAALASGLNLGSAAEFDGSGSFQLTTGLASRVSALTGPWAVEIWVQFTGEGQKSFLLNMGSGDRHRPALIHGYYGQNLEVFGGGGRSSDAGAPVNDRLWHHLLVVNHRMTGSAADSNRVDIFLDGVMYPNAAKGSDQPLAFNQPVDLTDWLILGAEKNTNSGGMVGRVDEMAIYDFSPLEQEAAIVAWARDLVASHRAAAVAPLPSLNITATDGGVSLFWNGAFVGPVLQSSGDMMNWTDVPGRLDNPTIIPRGPGKDKEQFYRLIFK